MKNDFPALDEMADHEVEWMHCYLMKKRLVSNTPPYSDLRWAIRLALSSLGDTREAQSVIESLHKAWKQYTRRILKEQNEGRVPYSCELSTQSKTRLGLIAEWTKRAQNNVLEELIEKEYKKQARKKNIPEESNFAQKQEPPREEQNQLAPDHMARDHYNSQPITNLALRPTNCHFPAAIDVGNVPRSTGFKR